MNHTAMLFARLFRKIKSILQPWHLVLLGSAAFSPACLFALSIWMSFKGDDTIIWQDFTSNTESPDHLWNARVEETVYEGTFVTVISAELKLVSTRNPSDSVDILFVDTGGADRTRPVASWTSPTTLKVHVWDMDCVKVKHLDHNGIHVELDVDPEGAKARETRLRQLENIKTGTRTPLNNDPATTGK